MICNVHGRSRNPYQVSISKMLCSLVFAYDASAQQAFEICDGLRQPIAQLHLRFPSQQLLCPADVRAALLGIISRQRAMNDLS
jgi:hypothetical protein